MRTLLVPLSAAALTTLVGCEAPSALAYDLEAIERSAWLGPEARDAWLLAEIAEHSAGLSEPDRAEKFCKMAASPFAFYRGSNHLFWRDLAGDERFAEYGGDDETRIWLQGDLHAYNYGAYDNDDDVVVYDLNDFDEVVIGDYQWDLWRMAVSLALIADERGLSPGQTADVLDAFSEHYLDAMADYRGNDGELGLSFTRHNTYGLLDDFLIEVADEGSRTKMLDEWTVLQGGVRVFDLNHPELTGAAPATIAAIYGGWADYVATTAGDLANTPGYFTIKDVAVRLHAGTGSLGTPRYYVLIEGPGPGQNNDRILDLKRQGPATGEAYLSADEQALLDAATVNPAERTLAGYRALVSDADDHLGWLALGDGVYSLRERSPYKRAFPSEDLDSADRLGKLAEQWGTILATAHARADQDHRPEVISHSLDKQIDVRTDGEHASFRALLREVALDYRAQVQLDQAAFAAHVNQQFVCE